MQNFVIGIGRGTGSLVGGVVGGTMMSTSAIVSTYRCPAPWAPHPPHNCHPLTLSLDRPAPVA